jgi:uncharacterized protein (TIGR03086 family)
MHSYPDVRPFHRTAVLTSIDIVAGVTPEDLDRPTPCAAWTLSDLLAHMTVQHRGFAAAARGHGADPAVWDVSTVIESVKTDPAGTYTAAANDVLDAFSEDSVLEAPFALPEFGPNASFPGSQAIGFHFVDYVVHGWDAARAIDAPFALPADVIAAVLPLVLVIPDGVPRTEPGSVFAPGIEAAEGVSDLDRVLLHLGRSPGWTGRGATSPRRPL